MVRARDGIGYDLRRYTEGVDFVRRKTGFGGSRVVFRADILGTVEQPVEQPEPAPVVPVAPVVQAEPMIVVRPAELDDKVRTARVVRRYPNGRWVDTDLCGRVFVGGKGNQIKIGQIVQVKNGELYLR